MTDARPRLSPGVVNTIALIVTVVWGAGFIADIALPSYNAPSQTTTVLLALIGALFGSNLLGKG